MGVYEDWIQRVRIKWMRGPIMRAFAAVLGDATLDWARTARRETMPLLASEPANGITANDRQIIRGPAESAASFAERLARAPLQWQLAGSPLGLLVQLHFAGFEGAVLVTQNGLAFVIEGTPSLDDLETARDTYTAPSWFSFYDLGSNPAIPASTDGKPAIAAGTIPWWTFGDPMDAEGNQYNSRFGLLFPATATDPDLGDADRLATFRRIVHSWRDGKAKFMGTWVATAGTMWGWPPDITWGSFNWGGTVTFYAPE